MKTNWPLFALAVGAFSIGTTEFAPMGLLPDIAQGVGVTIPAAGLLVSAYALGVLLGAPVMTLAFGRVPARSALIGLMAIFTLGNFLSSFAPDYRALMAARVITSLTHGAFFGIGAVFAASLVAPERRASAIATMFMGLTIANIGGVPVAAWIGQAIGWRMAFAGIALLGLVTIGSMALALPRGKAGPMPDIRRELGALVRPAVLLALATTVLSAGAMFTLYTYIAPTLQHLTGASPTFVTLMLILIGIGFTLGNCLGGRLADRSLDGSLMAFLGLLTVIMLVFPVTARTNTGAAITLLLWAMAAFAIVAPLQMRVMRAASDAPGLASSINIGAFNLGNAIGAAAGGGVLAVNASYAIVPLAGALLAAGGLSLTFFSHRD